LSAVRGLCLLLVVLSAGCSGLKTYPSGPGGNLAVRTQMEGNVRAALHVHRVDAQCRTEYQGTVQLDRPSVVLNLPAGQPSYLVVEFDTSSFLGGNRSTAAGMLLNARPGNGYELAVRYRDSIYDVALSETDPRARQQHALPRRDLSACQARG
jgi:hypothetical protein